MTKARRGRARKKTVEPTLEAVLNCAYGNLPPSENFSPADAALARRNFDSAATLYKGAIDTAETRAKHGFCLAMLNQNAEAGARLDEANVGNHPVARAVLAWVLAGSRGRRLQGFVTDAAREEREQRRAIVKKLLHSALATERPHTLVFTVAFDVLGIYHDEAQALADRARHLYPEWGWPHAIFAARARRGGTFDSSVLDALMRTQATSLRAEVFEEAYIYALNLRRFDDAERIVDTIEKLVRADRQQGDRNEATIAEMRAMIGLHRGRTGDAQAYRTVAGLLAEFASAVLPVADGRNPLCAPKFLLQAVLETNQQEAIAHAANVLIERSWSVNAFEELANWTPLIETPSMRGVLHFSHFGFSFPDDWRRVAIHLSEQALTRWKLLLAANAASVGNINDDQVALLRSVDAATGPEWLAHMKYAACTDHEPEDYAAAGEAIAQLAERYAAWSDDDERWEWVTDALPLIDLQGSDSIVDMFEGALAWLQSTPEATGRVLLRFWTDCVADNGGKNVLEKIAALSLSRENSTIARSALSKAQEPDDEPLSDVEVALGRYPDPSTTRVMPEDLSLLEAASLIALLRASSLDHVRWTLRPLGEAGRQRFEPTRNFIGTMFDLMRKGVIAADESTPRDVFTVRDGRLYAHLDRVVWRISAHTLELQRAIRDMPRLSWPDHWRNHAPVLARDLGVEELTVYLEHLLEDRSLPAPSLDEVRRIFRVQLEHLSMAQCYYLAHKTMRETLDYQAKHRPGAKQVQSRVINLLRGNGERAIEQGWDTKYERVKELPASLLFEALHDVLTGWGRRAFEDPLATLTL